jgi:hypothetical protein
LYGIDGSEVSSGALLHAVPAENHRLWRGKGSGLLVLATSTFWAGVEEVILTGRRIGTGTGCVVIALVRCDAEGLRPVPHETRHAALASVVGRDFVAGDDLLVGSTVLKNLNRKRITFDEKNQTPVL